MEMSFLEILEDVIKKTGMEDWRHKSDPNHKSFIPGIREAIVSIYNNQIASPSLNNDEASSPQEALPVTINETSSEIKEIPSLPRLRDVAKNFAGSMANFARSGFRMENEEEIKRRLTICEGCEHFDHGKRKCKKCTCNMDWKSMLGGQHCIIGKW